MTAWRTSIDAGLPDQKDPPGKKDFLRRVIFLFGRTGAFLQGFLINIMKIFFSMKFFIIRIVRLHESLFFCRLDRRCIINGYMSIKLFYLHRFLCETYDLFQCFRGVSLSPVGWVQIIADLCFPGFPVPIVKAAGAYAFACAFQHQDSSVLISRLRFQIKIDPFFRFFYGSTRLRVI